MFKCGYIKKLIIFSFICFYSSTYAFFFMGGELYDEKTGTRITFAGDHHDEISLLKKIKNLEKGKITIEQIQEIIDNIKKYKTSSIVEGKIHVIENKDEIIKNISPVLSEKTEFNLKNTLDNVSEITPYAIGAPSLYPKLLEENLEVYNPDDYRYLKNPKEEKNLCIEDYISAMGAMEQTFNKLNKKFFTKKFLEKNLNIKNDFFKSITIDSKNNASCDIEKMNIAFSNYKVHLLDAKILSQIAELLKQEKKHITVFFGATHIVNTMPLLIEAGFKQTKLLGLPDFESYIKLRKKAKNIPLSIEELFAQKSDDDNDKNIFITDKDNEDDTNIIVGGIKNLFLDNK